MTTGGQQQQSQSWFIATIVAIGAFVVAFWRWIIFVALIGAVVYFFAPSLQSALQERFGNNNDSGKPLSGVATADVGVATADVGVATADVVAATVSATASATASVVATPSVLTAADIRQIVQEEVAKCCKPTSAPTASVAPTQELKKIVAAPKKSHKKYRKPVVPAKKIETPCPCWADKITHPVSVILLEKH